MTRWTEKDAESYFARQKVKEAIDRVAGEKDAADLEPEENLRKKIVNWCGEHGYPCLFVPGWAGKTKVVRRFVPVGWPDGVILRENGRVMFCELKSAAGRLRKEQVEQRRIFRWLGHPVHVLRSFKGFLAAFCEE